MDPTLATGQAPMPAQVNPQAAAQNAMMLQALQQATQNGQTGMGGPPPGAGMAGQQPMAAQPPMPPQQMTTPPVDPSTMTGGLGSMAGMQPPNPIAQALMSPIPGGNQ